MASLRNQIHALQQQLDRQSEFFAAQRAASAKPAGASPLPAPDATASRANLRLPPFWLHNPVMWFNQVEAQFDILNISDGITRFRLLIAHLEPQYASKVDIINAPPGQAPYQHLKNTLIRRTTASDDERLNMVLSDIAMGDRKPSEYLRHLRSLVARDTLSDSVLRSIWIKRMRPQMQAAIAAQKDADLATLAAIADTVYETVNTSSLHIAAASPHSSTSLDDVLCQMKELRQELSAIKSEKLPSSQQRRSSDFRSDSRNLRHPPRRNREHPSGPIGMCWYHRRFGASAWRCTSPCNYEKSGNAAGSQP